MDATKDVTKNKTTFIQARNLVLEATGKKGDTVEGSFVAKDSVKPEYVANEFEAEPEATKFEVEFTEPVFDNGDVKYYFDGEAVTAVVYTNDAKTLTVTLPSGSKLEEGSFKFDAVGLQDYSGNHTMPNQLTTTIKVLEEDVKVEAPQLLALNQVHDGAFELVFDKAVDSGKVTIKNLLGDNADKVITIASAAIEDTDKTSENYGKYVTKIDFAEGDDTNGILFSKVYKNNATKIYRTVIVEDYKVGSSEKGKKQTKNEMFVLDNLAPTVAKVAANATLEDIVVTFEDAPFNGSVVIGSATDKVIIKYAEDGITYTYDIAAPVSVTTNAVSLGLTKAVQPKLFNSEDKLKNGEYTITLPAKLVKDDITSPVQFLPTNEFIGVTKTFKVTSSTTDDVPQTATNLVSFDDTLKAIEVKFVGKNIDPATATNVNNYTFAGKALPSGTVIEYTEDLTHGIAYIYLPENSVERNGNYSMIIENVATKSGAKMLKTNVLVNDVKDNTQPVLESAVVTSNNTVELTFDESLSGATLGTVAATADVIVDGEKNVKVVIGTAEYTVKSVTAKTSKVLVIETVDTFDTDQTVKVKIAKDASGGMYIYDVAKNKAAEKVVTATVNLD